MKHWIVWLILSTAAAGCATDRYQIPDWTAAERDVAQVAVDPSRLPTLCEIDGQTGTWSLECWQSFVRYVEIAETNTDVAQLMANALRKSDAAYDYLIEAGKLQQQLAQIRQELLEDERRARTQDRWFYRVVIALGVAGVAL